MRLSLIKKKILFVFLAIMSLLLIIYLYLASSIFMKTTYISDWSGKGTACYYFDNGLYITHPIKRVYNGGSVKESQNFEEIISRYHVLFPIRFKVIPLDKVIKIKEFAFKELDVMHTDMPMAYRTDCTATTTFYQYFKTKIYYYEPYGYLGILVDQLK